MGIAGVRRSAAAMAEKNRSTPSADALQTRGGEAGPATPRPLSALRIAGYALYNLWLCAIFYNTFFFLSAEGETRPVLYFDQMLSLALLAVALGSFSFAVRNSDKRVLSRNVIAGATAALVASTALLLFVNSIEGLSAVLIVVSAVGTGLASGTLFLGWGRLYSDVGARRAMAEISLAWMAAAALDIVLSLVPPLAASVAVLLGVGASGWLLRRAAFHRPERPRPARPHGLMRRTRRMFARGLAACALFGLVAGFSDVLTGFKFVPVPQHYEVLLALGVVAVVAVALAVAHFCKHGFVTYAYRATTLLMAVGCLMTPFVFGGSFIYSNVVVFGAYTAFAVVLSAVCIDISNYFDQYATRTFGLAFCALYAGELAGNGLGHLLVDVMGMGVAHLNVVALVLTLIIVVANLFLFTEKDLTETSLGEMTDEEGGSAEGYREPDTAERGDGTSAPREDRTAAVASLLAGRYGLTPREAEVLPLIIKGRTIARIQEELHISQGTVSTHTRHIYQKMGVSNRQGLLDMVEDLGA